MFSKGCMQYIFAIVWYLKKLKTVTEYYPAFQGFSDSVGVKDFFKVYALNLI